MVMSILHRITGAALYFGTLLLAWWLIAAAMGAEYFNYVNGMLVVRSGSCAVRLHLGSDPSHARRPPPPFWDTGRGFDLDTIDRLSWGSIIALGRC